ILAVNQVDAHGADRVLHQLAVEGMDQAVDGEHPLPGRARLRELLDVASEERERAAAVQVLIMVRLEVVAPADPPSAAGALEYRVPVAAVLDDLAAAGTRDPSRMRLGRGHDAQAARVE